MVLDRFSLRPTETDQDNQRGLQRDEASGLYDTESLNKVADQKFRESVGLGHGMQVSEPVTCRYRNQL